MAEKIALERIGISDRSFRSGPTAVPHGFLSVTVVAQARHRLYVSVLKSQPLR